MNLWKVEKGETYVPPLEKKSLDKGIAVVREKEGFYLMTAKEV